MAHHDPLIAEDISAYLSAQERKSFLRVFTCGSVDDGKSTLIGRLLYDSKLIYEDQMAAIEKDSRTSGTTGEKPDLALLVDGLAAEREQGITIDVAYRFFSTDSRKFIIADTPGHVQYTRNMATGASTADVAVLLIDARYGVVEQTRRHAFIASLLGIPQVVVAVNKMDLVDFDQQSFNDIDVSFRQFASDLHFADIMTIPVSALDGDNVTTPSDRADWYKGPTLLDFLETVDVDRQSLEAPFRLPVQWVNRPNLDFRGFSGTIASGTVSKGQEIIALPSGKRSRVKDIILYKDHLEHARQDQAVTLTLEDEIDISRGDMLCSTDHPADVADQFQAHLIWMDEAKLFPGRQYIIRTANMTVSGSVTALKYRIDVDDFSEAAAKTLELNEIGVITLSLSRSIPFDAYGNNRKTGAFIVVDRLTNHTVGAGMIDFALRRAKNIVRQDLVVNRTARAAQKGQQPAILWFTGLSGSGKSTIANLVDEALFERGHHTYTLDGDNVRHGLNRDLGFTKEDRIENIRRIGEVAKLMGNAGLIVMCSFISPYRAERDMVRDMLGEDEFFEIFVDTPLEIAEKRDVKGLYKRARAGEIKNFTGIDSEYQPPEQPDLRIDTTALSPEEAADAVLDLLRSRGRLDDPSGQMRDGGGI
ncbi:sulfate adenylyltransferase subunit CysN [Algimonas porphyrae]|uniref:Multifunctional fusion protein n=1 Tax=Algimonas porphyrae TaxID=1128113 RepID=A0ABQ5V3H8_9PROT|nr:sulfate adenylyltransferase subunit CysN [Algimonas porphyrae]GLQ21230.1 adenylyl-sulfate kinase [Algimonas porphyrae]